MVCSDFLRRWLENLPESYHDPSDLNIHPRPNKRQRSARDLVSPPNSVDEDNKKATYAMEAETPRKRRLDDSGGCFDATPRAASTTALAFSDASSGISRASSPKKQLLSLRLSDLGVDIKALKVDNLPTSKAEKLIRSIVDIGRGIEILPYDKKASIHEHLTERGLNTHEWRFSFQAAGNVDPLPGRLPSFEEVAHIHRKAMECQEQGHEEFSWNYQVQLRLLEGVFEDGQGHCDAFGSMTCISARPHQQFKVPSSPAKMIDLCVYALAPPSSPHWIARIEQFSRCSPTQTINHTNYEALASRSLLLSIETKKPGIHWDKAQLQIGLWHAAQWSWHGLWVRSLHDTK